MGVYRCISRSSGQVLTVAIWDMLASLRVAEALGKAEVDDIDVVLLLADSDQEVVRLDVSV